MTGNRYTAADFAIIDTIVNLSQRGERVVLISAENEQVVTHEILGYEIVFHPNYKNIIDCPVRNWKLENAIAEFYWYMTGNLDVEVIAPFLKNWRRFATNGKVNSNYGHRWREMYQYVIDELVADKHSRRACINMFDVDNHETFFKDTPCTLSWQFIIRDNKLHMFVNMRSNDVWYGLCNDQFNNSLFHMLVFNELKQTYPELELGKYHHFSTSMHYYESTVTEKRLSRLLEGTENEDTLGVRRFEIPEGITIANFWDKQNPMHLEFPHIYNHFKNFVI